MIFDPQFSSDTDAIASALDRGRRLAAAGQDDLAKSCYLEVLQRDPTHFAALNELGALAFSSDHLSAAHTAYHQAVRYHPDNPVGRVNLGNLLYKQGNLAEARAQFEAVLARDSCHVQAHQGLARTLLDLGDAAAAEPHFQQGFSGHAIVAQRYRGTMPPVPVLLLVSARGGNIPTQGILDDRIFGINAVYAEFYDPAQPLPRHAVVFNAIGDADICEAALTGARTLLRRTIAPVINSPQQVGLTGRFANAARLADVPGVVAPAIRSFKRSALQGQSGFTFPLLLRAPGFHTGQHFLLVESPRDLPAAVAALPGEEILALQYLDARGADGMARKYRVMFVDGVLYPLHLAISANWKVHYYTADMAANPTHREEERRFLDDMASVLGEGAITALGEVSRWMGLDYAGIDFAMRPDGAVLLFEANATMIVHPPGPEAIWDYRRAPVARVLEAVQRMVRARSEQVRRPS